VTALLCLAFLRLLFLFFAKIAENYMKNARGLDESIGAVFIEQTRRNRKLSRKNRN
jgi:hypothetical protein